MFSHVMVGANDLEASRKFYDAVLNTLGIPAGVINNGTPYQNFQLQTFLFQILSLRLDNQ